ncbi:MAG TPA: dTDP-4-dehydrorhamnose reductase, partial [Bacteroidales bacterium]|nr:dTDP-4-dehydrorhamnose reductase [Bacteroidales bacterium]
MATILVTGANGQLGNELQILAKQSKYTWLFTDIAELDICNKDAIESFVISNNCTYIINCAAYTAVDKAETDTEIAYAINATAPKNIAEVCAQHKCFFIHISTDYVFDGTKHTPYIETDTTNPQSIYGASKLRGENNALASNQNTCIIRTSWLYSTYGNNFVKTMIRLGNERDQLNVIYDQIGTPTYARDLAAAIIHIV